MFWHTQGFLALPMPADQAGTTLMPSLPCAAGTEVGILSTFQKHVAKRTQNEKERKMRRKVRRGRKDKAKEKPRNKTQKWMRTGKSMDQKLQSGLSCSLERVF